MENIKKAIWLGLGLFWALSAVTRTIPDPGDATGFFTAIGDKLLRSNFNFGITNIPVQTNGVFCFTQAAHRLLQVAANVRDASVTNFYPTVYRPVFYNDGQGNVCIVGFEQIMSALQPDYPLAQSPIYASALPVGVSTNNVYDVPWIIGAKKGFPNFNQFVMRNDFQIARRMQVSRAKLEGYNLADSGDFQTNETFVMAITNHLGFSFWNSYSSDYVSPNSNLLGVVVRETVNMVLSNAVYPGIGGVAPSGWPNSTPSYLVFATNFYDWPGSAWNSGEPPYARTANPSSFIFGMMDYAFLPQSAYEFGNYTFVPVWQNPSFESASANLPALPQFQLMTTNGIQAYILDGDQIIDYVQMSGPSGVRDPNAEIADIFHGFNNAPYQMWYTNNGLGPLNQMTVSLVGPGVAPAYDWVTPPNMPIGINSPQAVANFFRGMFTPGGFWSYNGNTYQNTNLVMQTPYTPQRLAYDYVLWQANDPLVHYTSADLNETNINTGFHYSDDSTQPVPGVAAYLNVLGDHYQPWGRNALLAEMVDVDQNAFNLAYRDPLVWGSDSWNFPATNSLPVLSLGQIHRGTPWQTIFLKATNILNYTDDTQVNPAVGVNTWEIWTGDFNPSDSAIMSPIHDWHLAAVLAGLFNTNNATQLTSVNSANWPEILDGFTVLTNSTENPSYLAVPELDAFLMSSNSSQAALIANAFLLAQLNQPNQIFASIGDILASPDISISSPWLNYNDPLQVDYGISDAAYEVIPSQILPLIRPDSSGSIVSSNGNLYVNYTGSDGFDYALESSTNLVNWQTLSTNSPVQGTFAYPVSGLLQQFYRSVLLP